VLYLERKEYPSGRHLFPFACVQLNEAPLITQLAFIKFQRHYSCAMKLPSGQVSGWASANKRLTQQIN